MGQGETYHIVKVLGQIKLNSSGQVLKQGDKINSGDKLLFSSEQAKAVVISSKQGRFILQPASNSTKQGSGELMAIVKNSLLPQQVRMSTRAGEILTMEDLKNHFRVKPYLVLGTARVWVKGSAFPMNSNNFFFVSYNYKGKKVNKKLDFDGEYIILEKSSILSVDGRLISIGSAENMILYYNKSGGPQEITAFYPVFPNEDQVKSELEVVLNNLKSVNNQEKKEQAIAYLTEVYGTSEVKSIESWLKAKLGI